MSNCRFDFIIEHEVEEKRVADAIRHQRALINDSTINVTKTWCDPSKYKEIVGCDFGGGRMHYHELYAERDDCVSIDRVAETLELFSRGTLVVVERAHLATPQTPKSLAQPFTADQLIDIYGRCERAGVTIKLFPHQHTRKARDWAAVATCGKLVELGKSSDINDARGLAYYVRHCNGVSLANPPTVFTKPTRTRYGEAVRKQSNIVLNAARARGYNGEVFPFVAQLSKAIAHYCATPSSFIDDKAAFSIAASVASEIDGEPVRFVYNGRTVGADFFLKTILRFSSVHHRGGVCRSNLCWHRFRPFLAKFAKLNGESTKDGSRYRKFCDFTPSQDEIRRRCWKLVRHEIKSAYRFAVEHSAGLRSYEVLSLEVE
jgi:hypothetical protein